MPAPEVVEALSSRFGGQAFAEGAEVPEAALVEAARALRDAHGYRYYVCASVTERADGYELLHGVRRPETHDTLFLKTKIAKDDPSVDSLALVWTGAEWHEREMLDLFGIAFRGHPDPRRMLMPDEYVGHPLRKEFPIDTPWGYRPATREGASS